MYVIFKGIISLLLVGGATITKEITRVVRVAWLIAFMVNYAVTSTTFNYCLTNGDTTTTGITYLFDQDSHSDW